MIQITCIECSKKFWVYPHIARGRSDRSNGRQFCSHQCANNSSIVKARISKSMSGENNPNYGKSRPGYIKEILRTVNLGSKNPRWKGGITTEVQKLRNTWDYRKWKQFVLKRDEYKCTQCNSVKDLHAHHIESFYRKKETRFDVNNGITLCHKCHSDLHGFSVGKTNDLGFFNGRLSGLSQNSAT